MTEGGLVRVPLVCFDKAHALRGEIRERGDPLRRRPGPLVKREFELSPFVVDGFEGKVGSWVVTNVHSLAFMLEGGLVRGRLVSFLKSHTHRHDTLY